MSDARSEALMTTARIHCRAGFSVKSGAGRRPRSDRTPRGDRTPNYLRGGKRTESMVTEALADAFGSAVLVALTVT